MAISPASPSSSPNALTTRSLCTSGVMYGWPPPRPLPSRPPLAIPYRPWTSWKALFSGLLPANGCSQMSNRSPTWANSLAAANAPATNMTKPSSSQDVREVAMYSIATNRPMNTALVPTSLSDTSSTRLAAQATRIGPRSRARGRARPRTPRLDGERAEPDVHLGPGHLADGRGQQRGQRHEQDPDGAEGVGVALEHARL